MTGAQGDQLLGQAWVANPGPSGWTLAGTADFDRDGLSDLVWQNDADQSVLVWYSTGTGGTLASGVNGYNLIMR